MPPSPITVLATGTFDLLHRGHLHYLQQARALGDRLCVIVASNETLLHKKGYFVLPVDERAELVRNLKMVDEALVGDPSDHFKIVKKLQPDIIALGYDQVQDLPAFETALRQNGIQAKVVRLEKLEGYDTNTTTIINRIHSL